jgi:sugar phosphate permease
MANWFPSGKRSRTSGRLGTSYIIGGALSWFVAATIIGGLSWRFTFWIPSVICIVFALNWYSRSRNAPEEIGLPCVEDQERGIFTCETYKDRHIGYARTLRVTLLNPYVWVAAFALFGINIVRYGFMDWIPTYIFETEGAPLSVAAYKSIAFPLSGIFGALFAGWASGRYFRSRKAPVALVMLVLLALLCFLFPNLSGTNQAVRLVFLVFIGALTFGPHVLVITALPVDLGTRKAASSVTGFIDAVGYVGAALTGVITGYLVENISWKAAFYFWITAAAFSAAMMMVLWRFERRDVQRMSPMEYSGKA